MKSSYSRAISLSLILYLVSLFVPVFFGAWMFGFHALGGGFIGLYSMNWLMGLPWLANISYGLALAIPRRHRLARLSFASIAVALGLVTLGLRSIPDGDNGWATVFPGPGFALWMGSFILLAVAAYREYNNPAVTEQSDSGPQSETE